MDIDNFMSRLAENISIVTAVLIFWLGGAALLAFLGFISEGTGVFANKLFQIAILPLLFPIFVARYVYGFYGLFISTLDLRVGFSVFTTIAIIFIPGYLVLRYFNQP